jgi:hypothetical protein
VVSDVWMAFREAKRFQKSHKLGFFIQFWNPVAKKNTWHTLSNWKNNCFVEHWHYLLVNQFLYLYIAAGHMCVCVVDIYKSNINFPFQFIYLFSSSHSNNIILFLNCFCCLYPFVSNEFPFCFPFNKHCQLHNKKVFIKFSISRANDRYYIFN